LGVALSGAGPSLLAFAAQGEDDIAGAMEAAFNAAGLSCRTWVLRPSSVGTELLLSGDFQVARNS
jgi:homoserine kinase